jgi:hypothetical protein
MAMFEALERLPMEEMTAGTRPAEPSGPDRPGCGWAGGLFAHGDLLSDRNLGNGVFWLPLSGEPVYLCRKGIERARLESPLPAMFPFSPIPSCPDSWPMPAVRFPPWPPPKCPG